MQLYVEIRMHIVIATILYVVIPTIKSNVCNFTK